MTKLAVYTEQHRRGPTEWLPGVLIIGGVLAVALIGATFHTPQSGSMGAAVAAKAFVDSPRPAAAPAVATMTIVPTDALGNDLSWSPLTGDGSN
ncbi:hypothetical protein [Afipia felis]|uniref:Uncharacterized protein n=2 Tax=Afipia felis TaxID=1035 RepID=A0A380W4E7_AFIFE|nr:hypothetical protein [Afipia felis]EKS30925.1 hypothetical protein HMPREF9697_03453 [Afipia felis ATCC 53690]SUU75669.1 Uncharacterised protein [Afipia felis]SUU83736.1 Uncharacterised protein [Afipia felis]